MQQSQHYQQQQQQHYRPPSQLDSIQGGVGVKQTASNSPPGFQWSEASFKTNKGNDMDMDKRPPEGGYISIKLSESPFLNKEKDEGKEEYAVPGEFT